MKIAVVGVGYVGLVTGTCLAALGCEVVCADRAEDRIDALIGGHVPFFEPGLEALVADNLAAGRLRFVHRLANAVADADVTIIAVGTPTNKHNGNANLEFVFTAAREIAALAPPETVIVTKSTVPAGTGAKIKQLVAAARPGVRIEVASNPEFLREGSAIADFMNPDRIVIGTDSQHAEELLQRLYAPFRQRGVEIISTDLVSSELIKYAANTFLATKVSFINEMADICERVGGNIEAVARGMGSDRRIGHAFLRPGPGYGGSCFPKDTLAMAHIAQRALSPATIVECVIAVNSQRVHRMVAKILQAANDDVQGLRIALLGLTFKPETDDVRDSVAVLIADELAQMGAVVSVYDPKGMDGARRILSDLVTFSPSAAAALSGAELCVIATEWAEFREMSLDSCRQLMARPLIVDLRNMFEPREMSERGFSYFSVGRSAVVPGTGPSNVAAAASAPLAGSRTVETQHLADI